MTGPGTRVGPYVIERELGRGGMGVVSVGRHVELGRRVALKQLLDAGGADAKARARFLREGQALAKLDHPGVVRVHEVGETADGLFLAMDLVEGESLDRRLERAGPLPPPEAARLVEQVARAMDYAHRQGVLHRDLKPANVLVTADGTAKVTDFGLARDAAEERERLTRTGELMGSPAYMPPEQASGLKDRIDARSDVYSLGATLFELVSGAKPFSGATLLAVLNDVATKPAPTLSSVRAGVDRDLEAIVATCLAKERFLRYRSAGELADDLRRYLAGEPLAAPPGGSLARLGAWIQRRALALLGAALVVAALGGLAIALALRGGPAVDPPRVTWVDLPAAVRRPAVEVTAEVAGTRPPFHVTIERWAGARADGPAHRTAEVSLVVGESLRRRVRLEAHGASVVRATVRDADGVAAEPREWVVRVDASPPSLTWGPVPEWLEPDALLTGTLSEGDCAIALGSWQERVEGTALAVRVPYEALARRDVVRVTDAAGNAADVPLPFRLVSNPADLARLLASEGDGAPPLFLASGDYELTEAVGRALGSRPRRVSGTRPLPAEDLDVEAGRDRLLDEEAVVRQDRVARLLTAEAGVLVALGADPGGVLTLRGVSLLRPVGPRVRARWAIAVASGTLVLDRCRVRSGHLGVVVGRSVADESPRSPDALPSGLVVAGSALVAVDEAGLLVYGPGRVRLEGSRVVGEISASATGRAAARKEVDDASGNQRALHRFSRRRTPAMVDVRDGASLAAVDSLFAGFGGGGLDGAGDGTFVALRRCQVTRNSGIGVRFEDGGTLLLESCEVSHSFSEGIYLQRRSTFRIVDCRILDNGRSAENEGLAAVGSAGGVVERTTFRANRGPGVLVQQASGLPRPQPGWLRIVDCTAAGNGTGVLIFRPPPATIEVTGCRIEGNLGDGVAVHLGGAAPEVGDGPAVRLTRCEVLGNGVAPVRVNGRPRETGPSGDGWGVFCDAGPAAVERIDGRVEGNAAGEVSGE